MVRPPRRHTQPGMQPASAGVARFTRKKAHQALDEMSRDELQRYLRDLHIRLSQKQARERAYLDQRARRGVQTPTDEVYEADQQLETELLALLEKLMLSE